MDDAQDPRRMPGDLVATARVRAAVYVLRGQGAGREVLVFDHVHHPEAGTQVPGGGVDAGETLDAAARREVLEETGLVLAGPLVGVGVAHAPSDTGPGAITVFLAARTDDRRASWEHRVTGGTGGTGGNADTGDNAGTGGIGGIGDIGGTGRQEPGTDTGLLFRCYFVPLSLAVRAGDNHHFSCAHLLL